VKRRQLAALGAAMLLWPLSSLAASKVSHDQATPQATAAPAYVAYYWRVRPGRLDDYNNYIRGTAERIDEDARRAGVFIEVTTVLATPAPDGTHPDWTHLRIFKLKDMAAVEGLSAGLDAATRRVVPDEAERAANSARAAEMRDFVRREVWVTLR
jgi:hypothetical protein